MKSYVNEYRYFSGTHSPPSLPLQSPLSSSASRVCGHIICFVMSWKLDTLGFSFFFVCPNEYLMDLCNLSCSSLWPTASLALWLRHPPRELKITGLNPACAGIFSGLSHTSDLEIGTPVATLSGAWCYRVSAGTGRPTVSIL